MLDDLETSRPQFICQMMVDAYILLKNLKFHQRMKWITVIFSWPMTGNLLFLVIFWHKVLIQDVEHQNLLKTGCNVLVNTTIFICDFQLANVEQPSSSHVLAQVADPRCGTSKLAQDS